MKFSRKHFVVGLIGNILVAVVGIIGIVWLLIESSDKADVFKFFTVLSNIFVSLLGLIGIFVYGASIAKEKSYVKEALQVLKLIAVVAVTITFLMVIIFLAPNDKTGFNYYGGSQLFLHLITPLVAMFSFIFLEYQTKLRFRFFFFPIFFALVYGVFYVIFAFTAPAGAQIDWYGFLFPVGARVAPADPSKFTTVTSLIFLAESLGGSVVFGFLFWLLNKIMNLIFIGYTVESNEVYDEVEEPKAEQVQEVEESVEETEEASEEKKTTSATKKTSAPKAKKTSLPATKKYKDGARVYHIARSKFVSRHWQVKLAGGEKAIKIFPTQAEAINFAKDLVRKQGGSIRIHSMKGQLRK